MPTLHKVTPKFEGNKLSYRQNRSVKVMAIMKSTHMAKMALSLRREEQALSALVLNVANGAPGAEPEVQAALAQSLPGLYSSLDKCRATMLDVIGWPRRPGAAAVKDIRGPLLPVSESMPEPVAPVFEEPKQPDSAS
jgi:hypothetical protein